MKPVLRTKIVNGVDLLAAASIVTALAGATLGFGGAVWWSGPLLAGSAFGIVIATLTRLAFSGSLRLFKSPLTFLGLLMLAIAILQLVPLPRQIATRLSPRAHEIYSYGFLPELARQDDPKLDLPEPASIRSPASLDRASTLRWLVLASTCLALFWGVGHYTDRTQRLYLVWGCVIGAFLLNSAIAVVQLSSRGDGLFGFVVPGSASWWAPSADDLLDAPGSAVLRKIHEPARAGVAAVAPGTGSSADRPFAWAVESPNRPLLMGTLMGGPGAFLALGSLALPLTLAVLLHLLAPRGGRERAIDILKASGQGGLAVLLVALLVTGSILVGLIGGPWFSLPIAIGLAVVGLSSVSIPGARVTALGFSALLLGLLTLSAGLGESWHRVFGSARPVNPPSLEMARHDWRDGLAVLRDFPAIGTGLGSFEAIHPYYKTREASETTAMSSLLQWGVESGIAGLGVLFIAVAWSLWKLFPALKRVGTADRCLAYGLIGATVGFSLLSIVHWTIELTAVAVSASALGGMWNRWLAGGTDLFVEHA